MTIIDAPALWLNLTRVAIIILTAFLAWITYRSNLLLKEYQPDFNLLLSPPELIVRVLLVGLCLSLAWTSGLPASQLGFVTDDPLRTIALGVGLGLGIVLLVNLLTTWGISRFGRGIYSPLVIRNILPRRPIEWGLVAVAFLPAVAMEELLFRTLWLGVFGEIVPLSLLIILTSILFGIMHQPQGQLGVIIAGGVNALLCILFIRSGELLLPLTTHYLVNLLQLILAYHQRGWLENY